MGMANHLAKSPLNNGNAKGAKNAYANPREVTRQRALAFIGGFFDGEGTVCLARNPGRKVKNGRKPPYYRIHLSVASTDYKVLEYIIWWFPEGEIRYKTDKKAKAHYRDIWDFRIYGPRAYRMAVALKPYTLLKKKQLALAIGFYWLCFIKDPAKQGHEGLPPKELKRREKFYWKMRTLNQSFHLGRPRNAHRD